MSSEYDASVESTGGNQNAVPHDMTIEEFS